MRDFNGEDIMLLIWLQISLGYPISKCFFLSFWPDRKWLRLTEDTHHKMPQMASETTRVETPVVSPGPSECDCSNVSNGVRLRFYAQQAFGFHLPPCYHGGWWDYSLGEHWGRGSHSGETRCVFLSKADATALNRTSFACSNKYEMTIE